MEKKILKKGWSNGKKYLLPKSPYSVQIHENTDQKYLQIWTLFMQWICVYVCEKEKKTNSFEITVIIFKAYKKCRSPIQYQNILFLLL